MKRYLCFRGGSQSGPPGRNREGNDRKNSRGRPKQEGILTSRMVPAKGQVHERPAGGQAKGEEHAESQQMSGLLRGGLGLRRV